MARTMEGGTARVARLEIAWRTRVEVLLVAIGSIPATAVAAIGALVRHLKDRNISLDLLAAFGEGGWHSDGVVPQLLVPGSAVQRV